ncbi:MAG TPA: VOC family protein [Gemmatimonadaceae bacterium]
MSTMTTPATQITYGTTPVRRRQLFVNIPVRDLTRSMEFFAKLGFTFNKQFTDATATSMLVGQDAYFMLLTEPKFKEFIRKPIGDTKTTTPGIFAVGVNSRAEVDELVNTALASGGSPATDPQDHGFMYVRSFYDLDGHQWEVLWMDPSAVK